jgi:hypothetical protein
VSLHLIDQKIKKSMLPLLSLGRYSGKKNKRETHGRGVNPGESPLYSWLRTDLKNMPLL